MDMKKELEIALQKKRVEEEYRKPVKVTSYDALHELITKFRKNLTYRKVGGSFYIPVPNAFGETIVGNLSTGGVFGGSIQLKLESGKEMKALDGTGYIRSIHLQIKKTRHGTVEENDELIKKVCEEHIFQPFVKCKTYRVSSVLTQLVAKVEYELRIPFTREMSEEEERKYIDEYLHKDDITKLIYQPTNIKSFQFEDDGLDEEWKEVA
jgi:hypothetical protein